MKNSAIDRFQAHVKCNHITGCDEWDGAHNPKGYSLFSIRRTPGERARCPRGGNKRVLAHKWLYEWFFGPVPTGYEVDHMCGNEGCVRLAHLQAITKQQNLALRGIVHLPNAQAAD